MSGIILLFNPPHARTVQITSHAMLVYHLVYVNGGLMMLVVLGVEEQVMQY